MTNCLPNEKISHVKFDENDSSTFKVNKNIRTLGDNICIVILCTSTYVCSYKERHGSLDEKRKKLLYRACLSEKKTFPVSKEGLMIRQCRELGNDIKKVN